MKQIIQLSESDIKAALLSYVESQGVCLDGKDTEVTLVAARRPNGPSAEIEINAAGTKKRKAKKTTAKKTVDEEAVSDTEEQETGEVEDEVETTSDETESDDAEVETEATDDVDEDDAGDEPADTESKKSLFDV